MSEHSEETEHDSKEDVTETDTFAQLSNFISASCREETPGFNMRLIAEVKSRRHLYDHSNEGYNVTPWRNAAWQEIADVLNVPLENVKTRWKTLRDRYKKEVRKEKMTGKPSTWVFQKPLKFIQQREETTNKGLVERPVSVVCEEEEGQVSPMEAAISFIENEILRNGQEGTQTASSSTVDSVKEELEVFPTPPKRSRVSLTDLRLENCRPSPRPSWTVTEEDEDEMFARMISARLSRLPSTLRDQAKIRMLSALYEVTAETKSNGVPADA